MEKEIEAKFFIKDKNIIRKNLKENNINLIKPEFLMKRKTFHSENENGWIRVRDEGNKITLAFKRIKGNGINDVEEIETIVENFEKTSAIINMTSFKESSYQENYREVWANNEVEISIDTWPFLQSYIEIEAKNEKLVKKYSSILGFNFNTEAYFGSVDILYKEVYKISKEKFIKIKNITFEDKEFEKILKYS